MKPAFKKLADYFYGLAIMQTGRDEDEHYFTISVDEYEAPLLASSNYKTLDEARCAIINDLESRLF